MKPPICINLLDCFGDGYRVGWDPAYDPKNRPKDKLDPWMMLIPCRRGEILPWGGDLLAVTVDGRPKTARRLRELGLNAVQDGDCETTFVFPIERFDEVADVVKPRKRRRLSAAQRTEAADRLRQYRFHSRTSAPLQQP